MVQGSIHNDYDKAATYILYGSKKWRETQGSTVERTSPSTMEDLKSFPFCNGGAHKSFPFHNDGAHKNGSEVGAIAGRETQRRKLKERTGSQSRTGAATAEAQDLRSGAHNDVKFGKSNWETFPSAVHNCGNQSNKTSDSETKWQSIEIEFIGASCSSLFRNNGSSDD